MLSPAEDLAAIREALDDFAAGDRGVDWHDFDRAFRQRHVLFHSNESSVYNCVMATTTFESAPAVTVDHNRIVSTPDTCGGKPRIAGSRIRVQDIYWRHEVEGKSADQIVSDFPQLSMADVYAALSYFWANRQAMLAQFEAERQAYEAHKASQPSLLNNRIRQQITDDAADHSVPS